MSAQTTQQQQPTANEQQQQPKRSSRRIRGLAPPTNIDIDVHPPPTPTSTVYLPTELKADVLARLEKRDLKSVRLVSREWNALATGPLFDRVYVSCRALDLEVFGNVARHPVIGGVVREVVFDGSVFQKDLGFPKYFAAVLREGRRIARRREFDPSFDSPDVQINEFVQDCKKKEMAFSSCYKTHRTDTFLVEGYRRYRDCSAFEYHCVEKGLLLDGLCKGLCFLKNVRSVVLNNEMWHYRLYEDDYFGTPNPKALHGPYSGSPLCRSWNPFHLRPSGWNVLPDVDDRRSRICAHFHMLTLAMSTTNKSITSLQITTDEKGGGLPQQAFTKSSLTGSQFWHFMSAYSNLRCLDIEITGDNPDQRQALNVLPELLWHTSGLRRLSLRLPSDLDNLTISKSVSEYYRYDAIFPPIRVWPELTELSIWGLAIGGWDLMMLILWRARVKKLSLGGIDLLDGTWEGVFQGMRYRRRLTELNMNGNFTHCGGAVFKPRSPECDCTDWGSLLDIEFYVVSGGRHPCLTPESDPDTADWWFYNMMPEKDLEELILSYREDGLEVDEFFLKRP